MQKKILFIIKGGPNWIAGVYYKRNIIYQICCSKKILSKYRIVIVCNKKYASLFEQYEDKVELHYYEDRNIIQKLLMYIINMCRANYIYDYQKYKFDIFHAFKRKAIYWIPDFQECYYPDYFTNDELHTRYQNKQMIANSNLPVVLSSVDAKNDYIKFFKPRNSFYVVPFVSAIEQEVRMLTKDFCDSVLQKYCLYNTNYILISNQFWQHKNHIIVFQAIAEAKKLNLFSNIIYVFTGELKDYRNSEYYLRLTEIINHEKIEDRIKILGLIDRLDQLALMQCAKFIIQPSKFEGWGTVLEDAKVLDKTIVLSDIPVHREQGSGKCIFFNPDDKLSLLKSISMAIANNPKEDIEKGILEMRMNAKKYSEEFSNLLDDLEEGLCR